MGDARDGLVSGPAKAREVAEAIWPRRLVWGVLLVWLSPAIAAVLILGGLGVGIGAAYRLTGRLAGRLRVDRITTSRGRAGGDRAVPTPGAPHLGLSSAGVRAPRRR